MVKLATPVNTKTVGGFPATITDIKNIKTDQLEGYVELPPLNKDDAPRIRDTRWDFSGIARDSDAKLNLKMSLPEHEILRQPLPRGAGKK